MTGEDPGGGVQMPPQGIPELLPGYIIPILGSVHNDNPPTTTAGIFQLRFGFIAYSFLWGPYPPLLSIHLSTPTRFTPLLHLSGV